MPSYRGGMYAIIESAYMHASLTTGRRHQTLNIHSHLPLSAL